LEDFERLLDSVVVPDGPLERIDRILLYVFDKMGTDDAIVTLNDDFDYSVAYARGPSEFNFLRDQAKNLGYLESPTYSPKECRLTIEGWKHIADLKRSAVKTNQAFIAMSFNSNLRTIYLDAVSRLSSKQATYHCDWTNHFNDKTIGSSLTFARAASSLQISPVRKALSTLKQDLLWGLAFP
jgi:hypothetical protein